MEQVVQTKIESYILKLKKNLSNLPQSEIDDVVNEIRSHIFDSLELDNSISKLDEVLKKIGNPKDYANSIIDQYISNSFKKGSFKENFKLLLYRMKFPFFITMFIYLGILFLNAFYLYSEKLDILTSSILVLLLLPSFIITILPIGILYSLPWAYYAMAKTDSNNPIKSWKLWKLILLVSIMSTFFSAFIFEMVSPSINSKSNEVYINSAVRKNNDLKFDNKKTISEMSFFEGKKYVDLLPEGEKKNQEIFNLYSHKIAIYLFNFIIPIFCVVLGIIMTSELFNNTYLVVSCGFFIPFLLYFGSTQIPTTLDYPIWQAFSSDIILLKTTLFMLLGAFLKKEKNLVK